MINERRTSRFPFAPEDVPNRLREWSMIAIHLSITLHVEPFARVSNGVSSTAVISTKPNNRLAHGLSPQATRRKVRKGDSVWVCHEMQPPPTERPNPTAPPIPVAHDVRRWCEVVDPGKVAHRHIRPKRAIPSCECPANTLKFCLEVPLDRI